MLKERDYRQDHMDTAGTSPPQGGAAPAVPLGGLGNGQPPSNNMGAVNTEGLKALLDWVSFTIPENDVQIVTELLRISLSDFVQMPSGAMGYRSRLKCGNISILSNGSPGMGCHVVMTGQGCRQYESLHGDDWKNLFKRVFDQLGHFARIDVAIDDYDGMLSLSEIRTKIDARHVKSRFKTAHGITEYDLSGEANSNKGETIYLGSPQSRIKIRFYDKAKEQKVDYLWTRAEIECHNERALIVAAFITNDMPLGDLVAGVLRNYINFLEPDETDTNKSRWPVSQWWTDFLGGVDKLSLTIKKEPRTIEDVNNWLERQVSPSLAMMHKYHKDSYDFLGDLIAKGRRHLKPRHFAILNGGSSLP